MSDNKIQKLELTWIGKENQLRLGLRILIEAQERSYGETHNMLSSRGELFLDCAGRGQ